MIDTHGSTMAFSGTVVSSSAQPYSPPIPVVNQIQPSAPVPASPVSAPAPTVVSSGLASKPKNSPDCWGNSVVFYAGFGGQSKVPVDLAAIDPSGERQAQISKCTCCPYEFQCETQCEKTIS